jgi:hypothetical protein
MADRVTGLVAGAAIIAAAMTLLNSSSRGAPTSGLAAPGAVQGNLKLAEQVQYYDPDEYYWADMIGAGMMMAGTGRDGTSAITAPGFMAIGGAGRRDGMAGAGADLVSQGRIRCLLGSTPEARFLVARGRVIRSPEGDIS